MRILELYSKIVSRLSKFWMYISSAALLIMMLSTVLDGSLRYLFNLPIAGVIELNEVLIVVIIFLGLSWTQIKGGHVSVELFIKRLPRKHQEIVMVMTLSLALVIFAALTFESSLAAYDAWASGDFRQGAVRFALWPGKATVALGTLTLCLQLIADILKGIVGIRSETVS